ncbi:MAG: hypothetical protein ABH870_00130 [bacterium]
MNSQEEINNLREQLDVHKKQIHQLELQKAGFGTLHFPPYLAISIEDEKKEIQRIGREIQGLEQRPACNIVTTSGIEHFYEINADFLSKQPELPTPESALKRIPRYEWKSACSKYWVKRKALTDVLERLERLGRVPGIIPIKGEGGSGKTALLKQLAVALFRQDKTVWFSNAGLLNPEFEDIANLNDRARQNNNFFYIFLDDFHKFPADLQENIINNVEEYWWNVILLVTYRDPIPGTARGIKRFQPITLNLQDDMSLFINHLLEISKESPELAHLLKEKESFINQIRLNKQIRLFIFLYLLFDRNIYEPSSDPEISFQLAIHKEYDELKQKDDRLSEIVKLATICANCDYYLPVETICKIYKDDLLADHEYYASIEHLFYISSNFLNMDVFFPVHDVIIDALILHDDIKYKVRQKQNILNILKHSIGRSYALLLDSMIYHREKIDFSVEELEPYIEEGLDKKIKGAYVSNWLFLLVKERGRNAGFEFAKKAIFQHDLRHISLLLRYLDYLPNEEKPVFAKQMVEEGVREPHFLMKYLKVLPEEERAKFAKQMVGEGVKDANFLMKCLEVLPEEERADFAKQMVEEGVRSQDFLMKYLEVLPEEERAKFAKQMVGEGVKDAHFLMKYLKVIPEEERADFAKQMVKEGVRGQDFLMKYLEVIPEKERAEFAKQMVKEGVRDEDFLSKSLAVLPEEEREDFAWWCLQNPNKGINFLGKCLLVVKNKNPDILRKIAWQNLERAKSHYSIPFWIATLSLFEGHKEFIDVLLQVEKKIRANKNAISLSVHLLPLYSRIGCTERESYYRHRKNLKDYIDKHPMNQFSLVMAYFYEREDIKAQNELRLVQSREDAHISVVLLTQLYLAWIDERRNKFDSEEIMKLESYLKSGKFKGELLISANQLLARVYAQKGEFRKADGFISQLQYNYKTEAFNCYTLGIVEELKQNTSDAKSYYYKFLAIPNGKFHLNGLYISPLLKEILSELRIPYPFKIVIGQ